MFMAGDRLVFSLWDREAFEAEVGEPVIQGDGVPPVSVAHNVASPGQVRAVLDLARDAGAPVNGPLAREWGGYSGCFSTCLGGESCRFHDTNALHSAVVKGVTPLRGASVTVPDVRAGFSSVIAAAIAEGASTISGIHHLERGYHRPLRQFAELGLSIEPTD